MNVSNPWSTEPLATQILPNDYTLIVQGGINKKIPLSTIAATSITKTSLATLVATSQLVFPHWYLISNIAEPFYVLATSANTLNVNAYSDAFPKDIIHYDTTDTDADNWFVSYREDTIRSFSAPYDWRSVTFGRDTMTFDLAATVYPITSISVYINGSPITISGSAANITELFALVSAAITAQTLDYTYANGTSLIVQQTIKGTNGYELHFTDGNSVPQVIENTSVTLSFYTFGNNINFSTNTFIPAINGNATNLIGNNIHISGTGRGLFGTENPKQLILGSSADGAMRGDIYMGEETKYGMIANGGAFMNLHNCSSFVIKEYAQKISIVYRSDFILEASTTNASATIIESNIVLVVNVSDTANYQVATNTLILPSAALGVIDLQANLYSASITYSTGNIVRSDGTNGGTNGLYYKSVANSNTGFLLSNAAKWLKADAAGINTGTLEIWNILQVPSSPRILENRVKLLFRSSQKGTLSFKPGTMGSYVSTQTVGALVAGQLYTIATYVSGDDFANVGAQQNATGVKFFATGTTPTDYTNGSTLTHIVKNLATSSSGTKTIICRPSPDVSDFIEFVVDGTGILSETNLKNYV